MMKKLMFLLAVSGIALFTACGGEKKEEVKLAPGEYDLSKDGLPLIVKTPSEPIVESPMAGSYSIKCSNEFNIEVVEGTGNMEQIKKDIAANDVNKFQRYITEEDNAILYESKILDSEFHFYVILKAGKTTYEIQDKKGEKTYTEEQATAMFEAAKAFRMKEAAPKE
jgi:hypothetical protein